MYEDSIANLPCVFQVSMSVHSCLNSNTLDRQHPKDIFDVRGLLENEGVSDTLMDVFIVYLIN